MDAPGVFAATVTTVPPHAPRVALLGKLNLLATVGAPCANPVRA